VLVLRLAVGVSAEQTAEAIGSTPGAVRVTQHRALLRLRRIIAHGASTAVAGADLDASDAALDEEPSTRGGGRSKTAPAARGSPLRTALGRPSRRPWPAPLRNSLRRGRRRIDAVSGNAGRWPAELHVTVKG
jgi:hypothetical protein